jgi:hypothetical protein
LKNKRKALNTIGKFILKMKKTILGFLLLLMIGLFISGCSKTEQITESANLEKSANVYQAQEPNTEVLCPKGIENDPYPGSCGKYTDENKNALCDLSE